MNVLLRAAIVLAVLAYAPQLMEQFEAPKAAVVRVFGAGLLALALVARARALRATPSRGPARGAGKGPPGPTGVPAERIPAWEPLDLALLAWLLVEVASTATSVSRTISLLGDTEQSEGLLTSLGLAGLYAAARVTSPDSRGARGLLMVTLAAVAVACGVAFWQLRFLTDAQWENAPQYGAWHRPFGSLGHANLLGAMAAAGLVAGVALAARERRRRAPWAAAAAMFGVTTLLTLSRAAWLAAVAGSALVLLTSLQLRPSGARAPAPGRPASRRATAAWIVGGLVVAAAGFAMVEPLRTRLLELLSLGSGSGRSRLEIWKTALGIWRAHPWLGSGPDTFRLLFDRFQTPDYWKYEWGTTAFHAHSIYLYTLATRGVAGILAAGAVVVAATAAARAAWKDEAGEHDLVPACAGLLVTLALAGLTGALGNAGSAVAAAMLGTLPGLRRRHRPATARKAARTAAGAAAWAAGGLASLALTIPTLAQVRASHAAYLSTDGEPSWGAVAQARRAAGIAPWSDVMAGNAADVLRREADRAPEPRESLAIAETLSRRAIRLAPQRLYNRSELMLVLLARAGLGVPGADTAAVGALAACEEAAPHNLLPLVRGADASLRIRRPDLALPAARRASALYPGEALPQALIGFAELALGDTATAQARLRHSLGLAWNADPSRRLRVQQVLQRVDWRFGRRDAVSGTAP